MASSQSASTRNTLDQLTGRLAGDGMRIVHLVANPAPVPRAAPDSLADHVSGVHGPNGDLIDWRLTEPAAGAMPPDVRREFDQWRSSFAFERSVGTLASVRAFLDWADHQVDVSCLRLLRLPTARLDLKTVIKAAWQLGQARDAWRRASELGCGIFSATTEAVVQSLPPTRESDVLIASPEMSIELDGRDLRLRGDDLLMEPLVRWDLAAGTVSAPDATMPMGAAAPLLAMLAASTPTARVGAVPLTTVFGPMLAPVFELTRMAMDGDGVLRVRLGHL